MVVAMVVAMVLAMVVQQPSLPSHAKAAAARDCHVCVRTCVRLLHVCWPWWCSSSPRCHPMQRQQLPVTACNRVHVRALHPCVRMCVRTLRRC